MAESTMDIEHRVVSTSLATINADVSTEQGVEKAAEQIDQLKV